ncbi:MAG TPA: hypothetical protein HPP77_03370 [Candidatus Hydrogenedentes bacterium]|nr:hypothetical protein [Candidatus Hydrogenedentota bacterium]HIJ72775.1 hypothetical protein [Candidatus Hydrogenedentota bacterium]
MCVLRNLVLTVLVVFFLLIRFAYAGEAQPVTPDMLGKSVKLRIVVDKVMQPTNDWVTEEWMVETSAAAGFNVYSPRIKHDRLDEVKCVARRCATHGIFHMPWMRGSLPAPDEPAADGKRVTWGNGAEQPLWSPNSDEFWEWLTRYVLAYARIASKDPHLVGVFLDFENYAPGNQGNLYSISYDDVILKRFAESRELLLPDLPNGARKQWLEEQRLHDDFEDFQIAFWRAKCRGLRAAVDEYAPGFRFCIYPAPGTPFMVQAIYQEWATASAPLILGDPSTYGRPSRFMQQEEALKANRRKLLDNMRAPEEAGIAYLYAGGIDPIVRGADPEFCGKNAVVLSETGHGYWVFYEQLDYEKQHPEYWRWLTWANETIAAGRLDAWKEPRESPVTWLSESLGLAHAGETG